MEIDITSPDGNTLVALGHATRLLKAAGADKAEIDGLRKDVMGASSYSEARMLITTATNGAITFYDPDEVADDDD
jgi:hypothetical protein